MAQPNFSDPSKLVLGFGFAFHQKRIADSKNRQIIGNIMLEITGKPVKIECILDKDAKPLKVSAEMTKVATGIKPPNLSTISNIFGGAELLES